MSESIIMNRTKIQTNYSILYNFSKTDSYYTSHKLYLWQNKSINQYLNRYQVQKTVAGTDLSLMAKQTKQPMIYNIIGCSYRKNCTRY